MSPNGDAPNFKDTPQALGAIWAHVCVIRARVSDLPCKDHIATIDANKAAVATLKAATGSEVTRDKGRTTRTKMVLDVAWRVAVLVSAGLWGVSNAGHARRALNGTAPATPRVTTSATP